MEEIIYHYVFRTYKGRSILTDPETIEFLYKTFINISLAKGFKIIASKIMEDHVHCLISFDSKHRPDYVVRMIKGISSREFFKAFKTNRLVYRKLWGRSYFGEQINEDKFNIVINYINNQTDKSGIDKRYTKNNREPRNLRLKASVSKKQ